MNKKVHRIKLNKTWQKLFGNKPLIFIVAVLVLAIVFTNKNISQYFKPSGSQAAGWTVKQIPGLPAGAPALDVDGKYVVTYGSVVNNNKSLYLYNLATPTVNPKLIPKIDYIDGLINNGASIQGNNVVWTQVRSAKDGTDVYMYNIATNTTKRLTSSATSKARTDVYGDKIAYLNYDYKQSPNTYDEIFLINTSGVKLKNIPCQTCNKNTMGIAHLSLEKNRVIWMETDSSSSSPPPGFIYDVSGNSILPLTGLPWIQWLDIDEDTIVATTYGPKVQNNIFSYYIPTGKIGQITTGNYQNADVKIWGNKVVYLRIVGAYYEVHLYDLISKSDSIILSMDTSAGGIGLIGITSVIINWSSKLVLVGNLYTGGNVSGAYTVTQP